MDPGNHSSEAAWTTLARHFGETLWVSLDLFGDLGYFQSWSSTGLVHHVVSSTARMWQVGVLMREIVGSNLIGIETVEAQVVHQFLSPKSFAMIKRAGSFGYGNSDSALLLFSSC